MKDIRPKAEERARQRQQEAQDGQNNAARPPGAGFMSERTRAKEALRVEVNTYTGENVRKIAATSASAQEDRILRVAAYCRASTDDIDQLVSIELQKNNYRDMIKANPKWKYVGTYVDDGFSGTKQYKEISAVLGIEVSALKVFVHRQKEPGARKCAMCGKRLADKARASQRFCSIKCKNAWWKKHPNEDENDKRVVHTCASCGRQFISYNPNSKYCSRDCYYASKRKT